MAPFARIMITLGGKKGKEDEEIDDSFIINGDIFNW